MEKIKIRISAEDFDAMLRGTEACPSLKDSGDIQIIVKPGATVGGRAGAMITFTVQMPDGTIARAQTVTTVRLLKTTLAALHGWELD